MLESISWLKAQLMKWLTEISLNILHRVLVGSYLIFKPSLVQSLIFKFLFDDCQLSPQGFILGMKFTLTLLKHLILSLQVLKTCILIFGFSLPVKLPSEVILFLLYLSFVGALEELEL